MFESKRVVTRPDGEPTFHIFYEMMAGLGDDVSEQLHLNALGDTNAFFTPLKNTEDREKAKQSWSRFRRGMFVLGITESEVSSLCYIMASVILLGYTQLDERGQWSDYSIAEKAANLLGIGLQDLSSSLHEKNSGPGSAEALLTPQQRLETFVCGLYDELFKMIVALINRAFTSNHRSTSSIIVADCPGLQGGPGHSKHSSTWSEFQYNYLYERILLQYYESTFLNPLELYTQEGITFEFDPPVDNPRILVDQLDKPEDPKGILVLASQLAKSGELALRVRSAHEPAVRSGLLAITESHIQTKHCYGTTPVTYKWDKTGLLSREHVNTKMPKQFLLDSTKPDIQNLCTLSGSMSTTGLSRSQSIRLTGMRQNLKLKLAVDSLIETLRGCRLHFVHCLLPRMDAGLSALKSLSSGESFNIPVVRTQVQASQLVDMIRFHKQGYPDQIPYLEFLRRFEVLATGQLISHNEQRATESFLKQLQIQKVSYQLGFTQLFLRSGILDNLEGLRDEKVSAVIVEFQAICRGVMSRKRVQLLRVRHLAIRCLQRNIRKWFQTKDWQWWKLYTKVQPLINVHRTEEDLRDASDEVATLHNKLERVSSERDSLKVMCDKLEVRLNEVNAQLADEQMTTRNMGEVLDQESAARQDMEARLRDINDSNLNLSKSKKELEAQLRSASSLYTEDEIDSAGGQRIPISELESLKSQLQAEYEEKLSDELTSRKSLERKMRDNESDRDELEKQIIQLRRKIAKLSQENADVTLHAQEVENRNADLEKHQRSFDSELNEAQNEIKEEKVVKEKFQRERNELESAKFALQKQLADTNSELDDQKEKVSFLDKQIQEITSESPGTEHSSHELLGLKRTIHDLQQKISDLEQEVDDQAGEVQMLQQTKLRLEMDKQNLIQRYTKEIEDKDNDIEEIRTAAQRKAKQLQIQADEEFAERQRIQKERHELEIRCQQLETASPLMAEPSTSRYRKEIKRLKMLYRDAQRQMERADEQVFKQQLKQLRNQLEDSELNATSYLKSKKALESDVHDLTQQLDETKAAKQEVEERMLALMRDRNNLSAQFDEQKEDLEEIMRKYRNAVQQQSIDKAMQQDLLKQIQKLNSDNQTIREELSEATTRISYFEENFVERQSLLSAELKLRETESKLEFTQTSKLRSESGVSRLKEQVAVESREREALQSQQQKLQDSVKKLQRQVREKQQECIELQRREDDEAAKRMDMERQVYLLQQDYVRSQSDLKLALRRIDDLQTQLEAEFDSDDSFTINFSNSEESESEDVDALLSRYRDHSVTDSSVGSSARSAPEQVIAKRSVSDSPRSDMNETTSMPAKMSESVV